MQEPVPYGDETDLGSTHYRHVQAGTCIRVISLVVVAWLAIFATQFTWILYAVAGAIVLVTFLFHSLGVEIDDTNIRLWFGPGLISKTIPLKEVESCRPVRNSVLCGWGIRYVFDGWLWNVSGLDAVQLTFKDEKHFRIGTNKPDELTAAIQEVLSRSSRE